MNFISGNKITLSFKPSKKNFGSPEKPNAIIALLLSVLLLSSCAKSINQNIDRGAEYLFREGYPEVRMSAIGLFDEQGNSGIDVTGDIVYGSLVYKEVEKKQTANLTIEIRIVSSEDESDSVITETFDVTVSEEDNNITNSQNLFSVDKRFQVPPGSYTVYFTVIDQNSRQHTTRQTSTVIPNPEVQHPVLTNIRLLGKNNEAENPSYNTVTTYDVPGKIDSLKFIFQVTNGDAENPVTIQSELIRFESDTSYARSMSFRNPSPSSIEYKGIDYDERTTIQSSQRVLNQTGSVLVEFVFPIQQRGNYRFTAQTGNSENGDNAQYKARDFSIKSANYPTIKTPRELARPLAYLMGEKDYKKLLNINKADSLKRAIDAFWLKNVGNKAKARQVIELYYQRVEEANKQFSNFKEGWKTDPGMMYILFGRPLNYEDRLNTMTWFYSYNREDPRKTFRFTQPKLKHAAYPFEHYLLQRNFYYDNVQYQQVQRWLSGLVLTGR